MTNINQEIMLLLTEIAPTYFGLPPVEAVFPCISFSEQSNTSAEDADNTELTSDIVIKVEVWDTKVSTRDEVVRKVHKAMRGAGGLRVGCSDESAKQGNYHKIMEYRFIKDNEEE